MFEDYDDLVNEFYFSTGAEDPEYLFSSDPYDAAESYNPSNEY